MASRVWHDGMVDAKAEFTVELMKGPNQKLGAKYDADDCKTLFIKTLKPGLLMDWNQSNALGISISSGDRIVEANRVRDDAALILAECAKSGTLILRVQGVVQEFGEDDDAEEEACGSEASPPGKRPRLAEPEAPQSATGSGERYSGVLKSFHDGIGIGKIACKAIGHDIAVDRAERGDVAVGDAITFELVVHPEFGMSTAVNLQPEEEQMDWDQEQDDAEPESTPGVQVGSVVKISGLKGAPHLNGQTGTCTQWIAESGRWAIRLESGSCFNQSKHVKVENLTLVDAEAEDDAEADAVGPEEASEFKAEVRAEGCFVGVVKSFDQGTKIGSIAYNGTSGGPRRVRVDEAALAGFAVGDAVSFQLSLDKTKAVELEAE